MRRISFLGVLALALAACGGTGTQGSSSASADAGGDGETVTITGVDYEFSGVPSTTAVGTTFAFINDGSEPHEMVIYRINDDVTESMEEILAMPEEEGIQLVTEVGQAMAMPGDEADATVTVTEPGTYAMVCFVALGSTEENVGTQEGAPHFTVGMVATFEVTE